MSDERKIQMERTDRIEEEVKKIASKVIDRDLKDPRLTGMISVTKVTVSRDLKYCKVYVSMLGTEDEKEAMAALKSSAGYLRKEIGDNIRMHSTPEVEFILDDSIAYGNKIEQIIKELDIKPLEEETSEEESDTENTEE